VLEYRFSAPENGVEVRTQIIERARPDLAQNEFDQAQKDFGGVAVDPFGGTVFQYAADSEGIQAPRVWRKEDRFLFVLKRGTYVYAIETTAKFASEMSVAEAMQAKLRELDRPGLVLPLRAPRVE
jgi:hypothetical protein